eukprot:2679973-Karenia_brevis.AAC.1
MLKDFNSQELATSTKDSISQEPATAMPAQQEVGDFSLGYFDTQCGPLPQRLKDFDSQFATVGHASSLLSDATIKDDHSVRFATVGHASSQHACADFIQRAVKRGVDPTAYMKATSDGDTSAIQQLM